MNNSGCISVISWRLKKKKPLPSKYLCQSLSRFRHHFLRLYFSPSGSQSACCFYVQINSLSLLCSPHSTGPPENPSDTPTFKTAFPAQVEDTGQGLGPLISWPIEVAGSSTKFTWFRADNFRALPWTSACPALCIKNDS